MKNLEGEGDCMIKFPIKFEVKSESPRGVSSTWTSSTNSLKPITCAIPVEFNGPGGAYSPEDLFALSIVTCIISMFKFNCEKAKAIYDSISARATLIMNMDPLSNQLSLTNINIIFEIKNGADGQQLRQILESSIANCPVGNSVKTAKTIQIQLYPS